MDNRLRVLEHAIEVIAQSLALFLRMWLINSPEIPQDRRETAYVGPTTATKLPQQPDSPRQQRPDHPDRVAEGGDVDPKPL